MSLLPFTANRAEGLDLTHLASPTPRSGDLCHLPLIRPYLFPPSQPLPDLDHPKEQERVHLQRTSVHQEHLFLRLGVVLRVRVIYVSDGLIGFRSEGGTERVEEFGEDRAGDLIGVSRGSQWNPEYKYMRRIRSQLIEVNDLDHDIEDLLEQTPIYVKDFWQGDTLGTLGDLIDSLV